MLQGDAERKDTVLYPSTISKSRYTDCEYQQAVGCTEDTCRDLDQMANEDHSYNLVRGARGNGTKTTGSLPRMLKAEMHP